MSGYACIHRTVFGHPAFRNDGEAMAFAWMILKAQWRATRVRYKERVIQLQRGQLAVSQRDMANALDRDKAWVERFWKRLKIEAMIEAEVNGGVTVITICNYAKYQENDKADKRGREAPREAPPRQGRGTEQEREEGKKEEPEGSSGGRKRPTRLREDWVPEPLSVDKTEMVRAWPNGTFEKELEKFKNYWLSKGGNAATKIDWQRTWLNWIMNADERIVRDPRKSSGTDSLTGRALDKLAKLREGTTSH